MTPIESPAPSGVYRSLLCILSFESIEVKPLELYSWSVWSLWSTIRTKDELTSSSVLLNLGWKFYHSYQIFKFLRVPSRVGSCEGGTVLHSNPGTARPRRPLFDLWLNSSMASGMQSLRIWRDDICTKQFTDYNHSYSIVSEKLRPISELTFCKWPPDWDQQCHLICTAVSDSWYNLEWTRISSSWTSGCAGLCKQPHCPGWKIPA